MNCENSFRSGNYGFNPKCFDGKVEFELSVFYDKYLSENSDHLLLCKECTELIKKDARRHGYKVKIQKRKGVNK